MRLKFDQEQTVDVTKHGAPDPGQGFKFSKCRRVSSGAFSGWYSGVWYISSPNVVARDFLGRRKSMHFILGSVDEAPGHEDRGRGFL